MPQLTPSLHLLRRIGALIAPAVLPAPQTSRLPMGNGAMNGPPLPDAEGWLPIRCFVPDLDACGCSADYWIRNGDVQLLAFYCDRDFDGMPPGWFDRYGDPAGFEPDSFRPAVD
ncbi:hypothetical protein [Ancylobacter sp. G4_0304]|uniref:hypothetical protein n=1 Tax=Ancylobacter sp. G4_0304 TaxID=3114289 RepID=UPI0039C61A1A